MLLDRLVLSTEFIPKMCECSKGGEARSSDTNQISRKNSALIKCPSCRSNQVSYSSHHHEKMRRSTSQERKRKSPSLCVFTKDAMIKVPLWSGLLLIWLSLFVGFTEGLQCYECLSLYCESGAVCDAIKATMEDIFVPKRHFIHFKPSDICPEEEPPINSIQWANISRECERSDSICLVSPIEVHTVVDGKKDGKKLEREYTFTTHGYLRGCASRRKLQEFPETIKFRIEFAVENNDGGNSGGTKSVNHGNSIRNQISRNGTATIPSSLEQGTSGTNGHNMKNDFFYNMTNIGNGAEVHPLKKTYKDGYAISKIYSHVFYIDQDTKNSTRCYADNCNDKVKFRRGGTSGIEMLRQSSTNVVFSLVSLWLGLQ